MGLVVFWEDFICIFMSLVYAIFCRYVDHVDELYFPRRYTSDRLVNWRCRKQLLCIKLRQRSGERGLSHPWSLGSRRPQGCPLNLGKNVTMAQKGMDKGLKIFFQWNLLEFLSLWCYEKLSIWKYHALKTTGSYPHITVKVTHRITGFLPAAFSFKACWGIPGIPSGDASQAAFRRKAAPKDTGETDRHWDFQATCCCGSLDYSRSQMLLFIVTGVWRLKKKAR